ncbi:MAG: class I SAM-dependent methyltransferase [Candidatus Hydrogenedentes bacterium]|nr:class I SAM-dependent methyltransferase [Candidatus Hydrogenedentota bacterium]
MSSYDAWADYYDLIHTGLPGEAEFYVGQAVRIGGITLELGCGTGRLAIPMAMSGVHVVGLDNSRPMLEICQAKIEAIGDTPGRLDLVEADMIDFSLDARFDFIAMAYRTFMHALTQEDQHACLGAVHRHLKDDGLFVLNVWAARPSLIARFLGGHGGTLRLIGRHPAPEGNGRLVHYCAATYNEHAQTFTETHVLEEVDEDGRITGAIDLPLTRVWFTPREMGNLLRSCGFTVEAVFGDFDCRPFTDSSSEMIWLLRK